MLQDFKAFILRGNVIDLAIAVVIGAAFTRVVNAVTDGLVSPLLAIPGDAAAFREQTFSIAGSTFFYGLVIDAIVNFLIVAAVLFFLILRPVNALMNRRKTEPAVTTTTRDCPECLSNIPVAARRCAFCTAEVTAA